MIRSKVAPVIASLTLLTAMVDARLAHAQTRPGSVLDEMAPKPPTPAGPGAPAAQTAPAPQSAPAPAAPTAATGRPAIPAARAPGDFIVPLAGAGETLEKQNRLREHNQLRQLELEGAKLEAEIEEIRAKARAASRPVEPIGIPKLPPIALPANGAQGQARPPRDPEVLRVNGRGERWLATLRLADGNEVVVRAGDRVDGLTIRRIDERGVEAGSATGKGPGRRLTLATSREERRGAGSEPALGAPLPALPPVARAPQAPFPGAPPILGLPAGAGPTPLIGQGAGPRDDRDPNREEPSE